MQFSETFLSTHLPAINCQVTAQNAVNKCRVIWKQRNKSTKNQGENAKNITGTETPKKCWMCIFFQTRMLYTNAVSLTWNSKLVFGKFYQSSKLKFKVKDSLHTLSLQGRKWQNVIVFSHSFVLSKCPLWVTKPAETGATQLRVSALEQLWNLTCKEKTKLSYSSSASSRWIICDCAHTHATLASCKRL